MNGGVFCSGNLVYDILVRPVQELVWGASVWVESIEHHLGGNGAATTCALARLGVPVKLAGPVGRDAAGDRLVEILGKAGADTSLIERWELPTATTVGLVSPSGERMLLHQPGVSAVAMDQAVDFSSPAAASCSHYHLANLYALSRFRAHGPESLRRARAAGLTTSLDTAWDSLGLWMETLAPCLPYVDILFANQSEARMLAGAQDEYAAARRFLAQGAGQVVLKLGGEGCAIVTPEGEIRSPGFPVTVADTTGAGDCFVGGFLAGRYYGLPPEGCARLANAAGALSVQRIGTTTGLLSYPETIRWMERFSPEPAPGP